MCIVCEGEERYMFADFGEFTMMGYVAQAERYPNLHIFVMRNEDEEPNNGFEVTVEHNQILAFCPICGRQLCDDDLVKEISDIYGYLHEKRKQISETISHEL